MNNQNKVWHRWKESVAPYKAVFILWCTIYYLLNSHCIITSQHLHCMLDVDGTKLHGHNSNKRKVFELHLTFELKWFSFFLSLDFLISLNDDIRNVTKYDKKQSIWNESKVNMKFKLKWAWILWINDT